MTDNIPACAKCLPAWFTPDEFTDQSYHYYLTEGQSRLYRAGGPTDGPELAVLVSPDYGAGFFTWNYDGGDGDPFTPFQPEIVAKVLTGNRDEITKEWMQARCFTDDGTAEGYAAVLGVRDLTVQWVRAGTLFSIDEYDGAESIQVLSVDRNVWQA